MERPDQLCRLIAEQLSVEVGNKAQVRGTKTKMTVDSDDDAYWRCHGDDDYSSMTWMVTDWFLDSLFRVSVAGAPATKVKVGVDNMQ